MADSPIVSKSGENLQFFTFPEQEVNKTRTTTKNIAFFFIFLLFLLAFCYLLWYIGRVMTTKTKENTMKKIYEYITVTLFVIGIMSLIGATGAIEADQWLLGGAMALLGIAFSILGLYSQEMEKEAQ